MAKKQKRTKKGSHHLVIKFPISDFELGIDNLGIGDWLFRIKDWGKINPQYLIQNHQLVILLPIGDFHL